MVETIERKVPLINDQIFSAFGSFHKREANQNNNIQMIESTAIFSIIKADGYNQILISDEDTLELFQQKIERGI